MSRPPRRDVTEIGEFNGPRGGRLYAMRLECGHSVWMRSPRRQVACVPCWISEHLPDSRLIKLLRMDQPYSVRAIVEVLADAAEHLLHDHDCDRDGWERVDGALAAAREWLPTLPDGPARAWLISRRRALAGFSLRPRPALAAASGSARWPAPPLSPGRCIRSPLMQRGHAGNSPACAGSRPTSRDAGRR